MLGETVGNFTIIERLGQGGMGVVWLAEQKTIKTKVAIKMLLPNASVDRHHIERFFNEAVAAGKIKHAGIVKIFDVGFHAETQPYLVMELLEGEPLSARIRRLGRFPIAQLAEIGRQIASVLEATHSEGITHRDLKPDNIYLVKDKEMVDGERVKILDFGIAKLGSATGITGTSGGSMGTPAYMSPEQWKHSAKVDGRSDGYALGCLMFEMATGRPPFVATSIGVACTMHLNDVPPLARSIVGSLPAELDVLIQQLLAKSPNDRPSIGEVKARLVAIAGMPVDPTGPTFESPVSSEPKIVAVDAATLLENDTTLGSNAAQVAANGAPKSKLPFVLGGGALVAGGIAVAVIVGGRKEESQNPPPPPDAAAIAIDAAPVVTAPGIPKGWVRIDPPKPAVELGLGVAKAPEAVRGFRKGRGVMSPSAPYFIQAYEVTWSDVEPWLAKNPKELPKPLPSWATDVAARAKLPVSGLTWPAASAYCKSIGGRLPTEEEWELAARGAALRPHAWGEEPVDLMRTRVFGGKDAAPNPVGTNDQDHTPDRALFDMTGNVQEWTSPLFRDDEPGKKESWVQEGATSFRTIRGLPLDGEPPKELPAKSAAYRQEYCSTGACIPKSMRLRLIGFRCARDE